MSYYQNLNKENFWNEMYQKYPEAMKIFCKWIDEYKKEVDWNWLFGNSFKLKFHDIPIEMQYGILVRFFRQGGVMDHLSQSGRLSYDVEMLKAYTEKSLELIEKKYLNEFSTTTLKQHS